MLAAILIILNCCGELNCAGLYSRRFAVNCSLHRFLEVVLRYRIGSCLLPGAREFLRAYLEYLAVHLLRGGILQFLDCRRSLHGIVESNRAM